MNVTRRGLFAAGIGASAVTLGGDMARSDDLAPLLGMPEPDPTAVRWGQGTVVSWDPLTGENVIRFRGANLANLPIMASSAEVLQMRIGDSVGLNIVGGGATATVYIVGRITKPGTPQAASFMETFGVAVAQVGDTESTNSTTYTDMTTVGPVVPDVLVGSSGRCLVFLAATMNPTVADDNALMSVAVSGATTVAPNDPQIRPYLVGWGATDLVAVHACAPVLLTGLNAGTHTFTAKYRSSFGGSVSIGNRTLIVFPL